MKTWRQGLAVLLTMVLLAFLCPTVLAAQIPDAKPHAETLQAEHPNIAQVQTEQTEPSDKPTGDWTKRDKISSEELTKVLSLLSLRSEEAQADLKTYTPAELRMVTLATLFQKAAKTVSQNASVAWTTAWEDDYTITPMNQPVNLLKDGVYDGQHSFEMIVGSAKQLDAENVRYSMNVELNDNLHKWLVPTLYTQDANGNRTAVPVLDWHYYEDENRTLQVDVSRKMLAYDQQVYLGLSIDSQFNNGNYDSVHVYLGGYSSIGPNTEITSKIWGQNMSQPNAGYLDAYNDDEEEDKETLTFTIVLQKGTQIVGYDTFNVMVSRLNNHLSIHSLQTPDGKSVGGEWDHETQNGVRITTMTLPYGASVSTPYKEKFSYYQMGKENNSAVELAVVGKYDSKEAAAGQTDVKNMLFGDGYQANYSGNGVTFSVFADGEVFHDTIRVEAASQPAEPEPEIPQRPGSDDTYFRVEGLGEESGCYVMPYEHDSYYYNGFQTVLLEDAGKDLSKLAPKFWTGTNVTMYATGSATKETSGVSTHDFSKGPVQYSASSESKENVKNYWVTFVKKHTGGAKLFINGINGPQGTQREVFLNGFYDNKHDIFLANIGDAPLTNLKAELINAQHVKLDPYWTVGEARNNTLAAFQTTEQDTDFYGELSNHVAKIRLLPDGEGDISGTLRISADGQQPVEIALTGKAGDPRIITQTIPAGVRYVPYGTMIQSTNMYDWNKVTFWKISGNLPDGMTLKPNGEIYGVPKETGTFPFRVRMENSFSDFDDSEASFTLEVKENTDPNVESSTDAGYQIQVRVPDMTTYQNQEFRIEGVLPEFQDLWLDGEKLIRGTDYDAESGSTKATIYAQTFKNAGSGKHKIAFY